MNDEDSATYDALARIARDGSNLTRPLDMDFFIAVQDADAGAVVAARATQLGFATKVEQDAASGKWTCYCTKRLVPAFDIVVAVEQQLDALAHDVGGYADGFGTFGNAADVD